MRPRPRGPAPACAAERPFMRNAIEIEDITAMRRRHGIDDVELGQEILALKKGDLVRLTFRTRARPLASETLPVRITSIRGYAYRGKLATGPTASALSELRAG